MSDKEYQVSNNKFPICETGHVSHSNGFLSKEEAYLGALSRQHGIISGSASSLGIMALLFSVTTCCLALNGAYICVPVCPGGATFNSVVRSPHTCEQGKCTTEKVATIGLKTAWLISESERGCTLEQRGCTHINNAASVSVFVSELSQNHYGKYRF